MKYIVRKISLISAVLMAATLTLQAQAISIFPWQQVFDNNTVLDGNWTVSNGWPTSQRYTYGWSTYQGGAYIITPAIEVPLSAGSDYLAFWVGATESMDVLVDVTAGTNIANFTDTLLSWRRVGANYREEHVASLAPYAGYTIRLAVVKYNNTQGFTLHWMRVDQDLMPVIEVTKPSVVITGQEALFNAVWVHGAADNIGYTWQSSLMGITEATTSPQYAMTYTVGGTDTLTTIVTNAYGADTVVTLVNVIPCPDISVFPWTENFDNSIHCWLPLEGSDWRGTTTDGYSEMGSLMFSLSAVGVDSWIAMRAIHVPGDADDSLLLSWDAYSSNVPSSFHHNYYILATTGNYDDTMAYDTLYHSSPDYTWPMWPSHFSGCVPIGQYAGQTIHIAFRNHPMENSTTGLQDLLFIDNVKIYSSKPPVLSMPATGQADVGDTTFYEAYLQQGSASGLTYSWYSSLLGSTVVTTTPIVAMVYPVTGVDTLTLIATNNYGSDTVVMVVRVSSCSVQLVPWHETFSTAGSVDCWRGDWQWSSYGGGSALSATGRFASPLIDVPLDTVGLQLKWNKSLYGAYRVLVSPSGGYLADDFTDTLYSGNGTGAFAASLNVYAGQQVRIAFEKTTNSNVRIEGLELDYNSIPPTATIFASGLQVRTFDTLTVTATLNACSPRSFVDCWHSTLLDTTIVTGTVANIVYSIEGIDTITYMVSNQYGADTQQVVVQVVDCSFRPLPFSEDFNSVEGALPMCWDAVWGGSDANAPQIRSLSSGSPSPDGTPLLQLRAGLSTGLRDTVIVLMPRMADTLNHLSLSFWYAFESYSNGNLSVGYMVGDSYVHFADVQRQAVGRRCTLGLTDLPDNAERLAFRFVYGGSTWYSVSLDNIELTPLVPVDTSHCDSKPLPYAVNFNPNTGTIAQGEMLPACWQSIWGGAANNAPHVGLFGTAYFSPDNTEALIVNAGVYNGYDTVAYIILPGFADTLKNLSVSFWYAFENVTKGTLAVGYIEDSVFVSVIDVIPAQYNASAGVYGRRDTVSFSTDTLCPSDARIALRWCCNVVWYGVAIDDLAVWYTDCPTCSSDTTQVPPSPDTVWRSVTMLCDSTMGSVFGGGTYPDSSMVTIGASALEGYHFVEWNDGDTNTLRSILLVCDTVFTAFFAIDSLPPTPPAPDTVWRTVMVTANVDGVCETYGSGRYMDSCTVEVGFQMLDTATMGGRWQFLGWSDGEAGISRNILVVSDTAVIAQFEWIEDSVGIAGVWAGEWRLYPNPASTSVTVEVEQPAVMTLLDVSGREVLRRGLSAGGTEVDISPLPRGVYFLRLDGSAVVKKLIVR